MCMCLCVDSFTQLYIKASLNSHFGISPLIKTITYGWLDYINSDTKKYNIKWLTSHGDNKMPSEAFLK